MTQPLQCPPERIEEIVTKEVRSIARTSVVVTLEIISCVYMVSELCVSIPLPTQQLECPGGRCMREDIEERVSMHLPKSSEVVINSAHIIGF